MVRGSSWLVRCPENACKRFGLCNVLHWRGALPKRGGTIKRLCPYSNTPVASASTSSRHSSGRGKLPSVRRVRHQPSTAAVRLRGAHKGRGHLRTYAGSGCLRSVRRPAWSGGVFAELSTTSRSSFVSLARYTSPYSCAAWKTVQENGRNTHRLRYESTSPTAPTVRHGRSSGDGARWTTSHTQMSSECDPLRTLL